VAEAEAAAAEPPVEQPSKPRVRPNVPDRPTEVKPVGEKLEKPKPVALSGPKLIRKEAPDVIKPPRSRRPATEQVTTEESLIRSRGPQRGRGAGPRTTPEEESGRSPRRRRSSRRGRSAEADAFSGGRHRFSEQDLLEREERLNRSGGFLKQRRRDMSRRAAGGAPAATPARVGGKVEIAEPFTIKDLSAATGIKGADIVGYLFQRGIMATINQAIDVSIAQEVCMEYDIELVVREARSAEQQIAKRQEQRERTDVRRRPPIVAVLGHVDHGKTSLLDKIRQSDVAGGEAGGITQHIGAYRATIRGTDGEDKTVVFLDTPGHEAFTTMRARGANLTDVVVLVVAADDGVMPQTVESINHAKAAGVPIVVALNKIDVPQATDANIQKILGQLAERELNPVEWGGQTEVIRTSAETGEGVEEIMEILDYQAELLELAADYAGPAHGQVIEAELSEGRGPVARVLVREGNLSIGDFIVMGRAFGRVRDMIDDRGRNTTTAGPATPVEISGIDEVPDAGDRVYITESLKQAEEIANTRRDDERKRELASKTKVTLDNVFEQMQAGDVKELRVVLKADVQGSAEVLNRSLQEIGADNEEVAVRVLHAAVGGITESDVILAEASDAIIVGFQVIASPRARTEAERRGVDIRLYRVIYDIVDDVKAGLEGMLAPETREEVQGHAEVREVFRVSKVGMVAGCYVTDGSIQRNALIRVTRDDIVIEHDRTLQQLKRYKDDVRDVRAGMECGMSIDGYDDIRVGDILECYTATEVAKTL
jgi:translation initiation factor IF-2